MRSRSSALLCALLAVGLCACGSKNSGKKGGPDARKTAPRTYATPGALGQASAHVTAHASIVFTTRGAAAAVEVARALMDARTPEGAAAWEDVLAPVEKTLSGDPLDPDLYVKAGIDPERPVLVAFGEDSEAAAVIPLSDASKWRAFLSEEMGEALEADSVLIGDVTRIGRRSSYVVVGDYACVTRYDRIAAACTGASRAGARPLADDPHFASFVKNTMADQAAASVFFAPRGEAFGELVDDLPRRDLDPMRVAKVLAALTGFGMTASLEGDGFAIKTFTGIERGPAARAKALTTAPRKLDLTGRVSPDALLFTRAAFDPLAAGEAGLDMIDERSLLQLEEGLAELREDATISIRLREDVFARSGGHVALAYFPAMETQPEGKRPSDLDPPGAAFAAFADTSSAEATEDVQKLIVLAAGLAEAGEITKLDDGKITSVAFEGREAPTLYIGHDGLVLASPVLDPKYAVTLLKGGGERAQGDLARALTSEFAAYAKPKDLLAGAGLRGEDAMLASFLPETAYSSANPIADGFLVTGTIAPAALLGGIPRQLAKEKMRDKITEADEYSRLMLNGCRAYFVTNQMVTGPDGAEPWHTDGAPGASVPTAQRTMPGGVNYTFVSHDALPKDFAKIPFKRRTNPVDVATFDRLNFYTPTSSMFRYTYSTGPGVGGQATCTVTAEADFDPSTPAVHTRTQTAVVDSGGSYVRIEPAVVTNELE
jgi:hypothetical protein